MTQIPIVGNSLPPLDDLLKLDIQVPAPGFMDEATLNNLVAELATQNAILSGHAMTLRRTCESLRAQVDGLKGHIRQMQAVPNVEAPVEPEATTEDAPLSEWLAPVVQEAWSDGVMEPAVAAPEPKRPVGYVSPYATNGVGA